PGHSIQPVERAVARERETRQRSAACRNRKRANDAPEPRRAADRNETPWGRRAAGAGGRVEHTGRRVDGEPGDREADGADVRPYGPRARVQNVEGRGLARSAGRPI